MANKEFKVAPCAISKKMPSVYRQNGVVYRISCNECGATVSAPKDGKRGNELIKLWNDMYGCDIK